MIRKVIIVGMSFGAIVSTVLLPLSLAAGFGYVQPRRNVFFGGGAIALDFMNDYSQFSIPVTDGWFWGPPESSVPKFIFLPVGNLHQKVVFLPLWIPIVLFGIYPTLTFIRGPLRRWRRKRKGMCLSCGYDLTGNVTGVCSECGVSVNL